MILIINLFSRCFIEIRAKHIKKLYLQIQISNLINIQRTVIYFLVPSIIVPLCAVLGA